MKAKSSFSEEKLRQFRQVCREESRLAAVYVFGLRRRSDLDLAALYTESLTWPERIDLEVSIAEALELDRVELANLRRMPLVFRFGVLNEGEPIYVGQPEDLAIFIEQTIARYSAFYPLLEALYWRVETKPLAEDRLDQMLPLDPT